MLSDHSHVVQDGMMAVPVLPKVRVARIMSIGAGAPLNVQEICMATHAGTHIDAPLHALDGAVSLDRVPLDAFHGPGIVIPIARGAGEAIPPEELQRADVRPQDIVLLATGWDRFFGDKRYFIHPYLSDAAADWLAARRVKMVAMDVLSPDQPMALRDAGFCYYAHRRLLADNILIAENLRALGPLAGRRVTAFAFPVTPYLGDGGPVRFVLES